MSGKVEKRRNEEEQIRHVFLLQAPLLSLSGIHALALPWMIRERGEERLQREEHRLREQVRQHGDCTQKSNRLFHDCHLLSRLNWGWKHNNPASQDRDTRSLFI